MIIIYIDIIIIYILIIHKEVDYYILLIITWVRFWSDLVGSDQIRPDSEQIWADLVGSDQFWSDLLRSGGAV